MEICSKCGSSWEEHGHTSERPSGWGKYYYCSVCKTRRKPKSYSPIVGSHTPTIEEVSQGFTNPYVINRITSDKVGNSIIIGDVHLPFEKKGYLEFCRSIYDKYGCDMAYSVGDFLDEHKMSFHDHDPDMPSAKDEFSLAKGKLKGWYEAFPVMKWCKGNHDERFYRVAYKSGIPSEMMRGLLDAVDAPSGWEYEDEFWINERTKVFHGDGFNGKYPHANAANELMCNAIIGHSHSVAGIYYKVTEIAAVWGMSVGCGIDRRKSAFRYAKNSAKKPVISCGVVINGEIPVVELMEL